MGCVTMILRIKIAAFIGVALVILFWAHSMVYWGIIHFFPEAGIQMRNFLMGILIFLSVSLLKRIPRGLPRGNTRPVEQVLLVV